MQRIFHTPEGVRDIYNGECSQKHHLQTEIRKVFDTYGYEEIETPSFEYFEVFSREVGTIPSKDLYKFFDREGNTLVLRPDFTPSVSRACATYFNPEHQVITLSYTGNTFINNSSFRGRLKETTQCGAELIGDDSISADAEILSMVVDSLLESGLKQFQISVGNSGYFGGLIKAAGLLEEDEEQLRELISNKNFYGVEEFVDTLDLKDDLKGLFKLLGNFDISDDDLQNAKQLAKNYPDILKSVVTLESLREYITAYGIEKYVSYEFGLISDYKYYTGIIFQGFTYGTGEAIVKGGRYNNLLSHFGKKSPAIGFAIVVDQLMAALQRQNIEIPVIEESALIVFEEAAFKKAISKCTLMRKKGINVEMILKDTEKSKEDYAAYAVSNHINKVEFIEE